MAHPRAETWHEPIDHTIAWSCRDHRRILPHPTDPCSLDTLPTRSHLSPFPFPTPRTLTAANTRRHFSSLPDYEVLTMPALSPTMEQGTIAEWKMKEGDFIEAGSVMAEVETDKATVAFEAVDEGYLAKILAPDGTADLPVGSPVAVVVEDEGSVGAFGSFTLADAGGEAAAPAAAAPAAAPEEKAAPAAEAATKAAAAAAPVASSGGRVVASPLAKATASRDGVDLSVIGAGSGPGGRIVQKDVVAAAVAAPAQSAAAAAAQPASVGAVPGLVDLGDYEDIPLSNMRKVIAQRLTQSKQSIPHYYLSIKCNVDALLETRSELNAKLEKQGTKLSVNDFVIKASALSMGKVPEVNSAWMDSFIRQYDNVDVCVAVATPGGLMTPIVPDCDRIGLTAISSKVKELAGKAKDNKLTPDEFQGGTFTISNLGMFGVTNFSAIINPPQAAILAVGGAETEIVQAGTDDNDKPVYKPTKTMTVTLSCDHRVVDGAVGAQWLQAFKGYVEDPVTMLL